MSEKKKLLSEEEREVSVMRLTDKGCFYYLACKHGLCPKIVGGYDTEKLDKVWKEYEEWLSKHKEGDSIKSKSRKRSNNCANDSNLPVVPLLLGILAGTIIGKLLFLLFKIIFVL